MTISGILFSFVFVTLLGGLLASRFQYRNWVRQQQISNKEKIIADLKQLFIELDRVMSRRLYRTRQLLYSLRRFESAKFAVVAKEYDEILSEWNEKTNSFQIRLVRVIRRSLADDFEKDLTRSFVKIGSALERQIRNVKNKRVVDLDLLTELELNLDQLSRRIYEFLRAVYIELQEQEKQLYLIDHTLRVPTLEKDLDEVSTWFLFKTLFVPMPKFDEES